MKIATWNVNGIRARQDQVREWLERERPDVACLQELKAEPQQIPEQLALPDYHTYWHGRKGYSGVSLHVRREFAAAAPAFSHPEFDRESRIVQVTLDQLAVASVYVPNGGKDYAAKIDFMKRLGAWARSVTDGGRTLVICGDLNITRTDMDVHPKERKPGAIGQRPEERQLLEDLIAGGLVDVGRAVDPTNDGLFTWWAPWRNLRARNIGWRLDYVLAPVGLAGRVASCVVQSSVGTSDHAPVVMTV